MYEFCIDIVNLLNQKYFTIIEAYPFKSSKIFLFKIHIYIQDKIINQNVYSRYSLYTMLTKGIF